MSQNEGWAPVCPAPTEKDIASIIHPTHGKPTKSWRYEDATGRLWCFANRFDFPARKKTFLPLTFGRLGNTNDWHWKGPSDPSPLYGTLNLPTHQNSKVLMVEGESTADRAAELFPDLAVVTTLGGSSSASKTDYGPLANRDIIIWPDNDKAGHKYKANLVSQLRKVPVKSIRVVEVPNDFPPKWDLADDFPEKQTVSDLQKLLESAIPQDLIDGEREFRTTCLADVEAEEVHWLWKPYIARGCLTMLDGDPGLGKSHITLSIAASLSQGTPLPNQQDSIKGTTLIVSCEDSLSHTVKPRLMRMVADSSRIHAYDEIFSLDDEHFLKLRLTLARLRPDLLVIDPIFAYLSGSVDTNSANKVREILAPLSKIAAEFDCAILCIRHLNKGGSGGSLIQRGMGSMDFIAAARSGLTVVKDPKDDEHRVMFHSKSNLAKSGPTWGFAFKNDHFEWTGESDVTERDLRDEGSRSGDAPTRLDEAISFLETFLDVESKEQIEILRVSVTKGFTKGTMQRAKKRLGVMSKKMPGKDGHWMWSLPQREKDAQTPRSDRDSADAHHGDVPTSEDTFIKTDYDDFLEHLQDVQDGDHFGVHYDENHSSQNERGAKQ